MVTSVCRINCCLAGILLLAASEAHAQHLTFDHFRVRGEAGVHGAGLRRTDPYNPGTWRNTVTSSAGVGATLSFRGSNSRTWGVQLDGDLLPKVRLIRDPQGPPFLNTEESSALYWVIASAWVEPTVGCTRLCVRASFGFGYGRYGFEQIELRDDIVWRPVPVQHRGTWRLGLTIRSPALSDRMAFEVADHIATLRPQLRQERLSPLHMVTIGISVAIARDPVSESNRTPGN